MISRRSAGLLTGGLLFALLLIFPPSGLSPEAARLAAVLALAASWWITEAIPLPATALIAPSLAVLLGVAPAKEVFAPFGDPLLFLFIGSFLIAAAASRHGLDRRIAWLLLSRPALGRSRARVLAAFVLLPAAISMWISNTATAAMFLPVAIGVLEAMPRTAAERARVPFFDTAIVLAVSFGVSIGGIGTPVGTPPNLIGMGLIERVAQTNIGFFDWMTIALPILLLLLPLCFGLLWLLYGRRDPGTREDLAPALAALRTDLGPVSRGERAVASVFLLAVALWVLPDLSGLVPGEDSPLHPLLAARLNEGVVALLAAGLLFLIPLGGPDAPDGRPPRALDWRTAAGIDWGTIVLFGGGMSLGTMMFSTGLAKHVAGGLLGPAAADTAAGVQAGGGALFLAVAVAAGILVSEATSNTASATMVVPVVIAFAQQRGLPPVLPAIGATLACSFGFALPVSTASNAMAFGTGRAPLPRMMAAGLLLDAAGFLTIWLGLLALSALGYAPLLGSWIR